MSPAIKQPDKKRPPVYFSLAGLIIFILILSALELAARVADSRIHFYDKVLEVLEWIDLKTQPITHEAELPWPPRSIYIRAPEPADIKQEPYKVGGRTIPGAYKTLKKKLIYPQDLNNDTRQRIFIIGGSAAFGFPYRYEYSLGHALQELLGDDDYHVINAAQISHTSGHLTPIVRRIVDNYKPHLIIIFTGNNEWTRWIPQPMSWGMIVTVRTFKSLSTSRFLAWVLYHSFKNRSMHNKKIYAANHHFTIQKEIEGLDYALDNPFEKFYTTNKQQLISSKQQFIKAFRQNLHQMITYARDNNVRVILMTVPFNYKLSIAFMHPQPLYYTTTNKNRVQENIKLILRHIDRAEYKQAYKLIQQTLNLEPHIPLLFYLKGSVLEKTGQHSEAEKAYALSRENMIGHLGARLSINEAIRSIADSQNVELIDLKKLFDNWEHSHGGFYNSRLIPDDCHPSPQGQRLIAEALHQNITNK